jgi:hypothetical protein
MPASEREAGALLRQLSLGQLCSAEEVRLSGRLRAAKSGQSVPATIDRVEGC